MSETDAYRQGQSHVASLIIHEALKYLPEGEREAAELRAYVFEIRRAVQRLWSELDLGEFYEKLHLGDAIDQIAKAVGEMVDDWDEEYKGMPPAQGDGE